MRILLFNLLDNSLHFLSLAIIYSNEVVHVLECSAHTVKSLSNLALLVSDKRFCKEAFGAKDVVITEIFTEVVQNDCKVLFGFVV